MTLPDGIEPAKITAGIIGIPDDIVAGDGNAARPRIRVRQRIFTNGHRLGIELATLLPNSTGKRTPLELTTMPCGFKRGVGDVWRWRPFTDWARNHVRVLQREPGCPFDQIGVCGSRETGSGIWYDDLAGFRIPSCRRNPWSWLNQMFPALSAVIVRPDLAVLSGNSLIDRSSIERPS